MAVIAADNFNLLRKITLKKFWNLFLLHFSYRYSKIFKSKLAWGKPFSLSIEPTTACNLACPECPSGLKQFSRPTGRLKIEEHKKCSMKLKKACSISTTIFKASHF